MRYRPACMHHMRYPSPESKSIVMNSVPSSSSAVPFRVGSLGVQVRSNSLVDTISSSTCELSNGSTARSNAWVLNSPLMAMPKARLYHRPAGDAPAGVRARASASTAAVELQEPAFGEVLAERQQVSANLVQRDVELRGELGRRLVDVRRLLENLEHAPAGRVEAVILAGLAIQHHRLSGG